MKTERTPRRGKFNAVPTMVDNVRFASKREARRYQDLKLLERAGEISSLEVDKKKLRWPLKVNGILICTYEGDFGYREKGNPLFVLEDSKGFKTPVYRLKKKLMLAIHGIEIREV